MEYQLPSALHHKFLVKHHSIEDINNDEFVANLDPDIWKASYVCLLAQPQTIKGADTCTSSIHKVRL